MTEIDMELQKLRRENNELKHLHQLDLAEIVRLRRWIETLEENKQTT